MNDYQVGHQILGPIFSHFINWIYQIAVEENIDHLFFIMREGELYHRLFLQQLKSINDQKSSKIKPELLFISRRSLWTAMIESKSNLKQIIRPYFNHMKLSRIYQFFNLEKLNPIDDQIITNTNFDQLIDPVIDRIIDISQQQKLPGLRKYLDQTLTTAQRCILVNTGYGHTNQYLLTKLLPDIDFLGLYLCTHPISKYQFDTSSLKSRGFMVNLDDRPSIINLFWTNDYWIENTCMGPDYQRSTIGYDSSGQPVFDQTGFTQEERDQIDQRQKGILDCQAEILASNSLILSTTSDQNQIRIRNKLCNLLTNFLSQPKNLNLFPPKPKFYTSQSRTFYTGDPKRDQMLCTRRLFPPIYY